MGEDINKRNTKGSCGQARLEAIGSDINNDRMGKGITCTHIKYLALQIDRTAQSRVLGRRGSKEC